MFCAIPFELGWLLLAYAQNRGMLYAGRFITGLACGIISLTVPVSFDIVRMFRNIVMTDGKVTMWGRDRGRFTRSNNIDNNVCRSMVRSNHGINESHETENSKEVISKYTPRFFLTNYYKELQNYVYYILRNISYVLTAISHHKLCVFFVKPKRALMHTGGKGVEGGAGYPTSFPGPKPRKALGTRLGGTPRDIREVKHGVHGRRQTAKITSDFLFFSCNP